MIRTDVCGTDDRTCRGRARGGGGRKHYVVPIFGRLPASLATKPYKFTGFGSGGGGGRARSPGPRSWPVHVQVLHSPHVAAVWLETKMYILVLAIFGHFPAELGSRTVLNGFSLKNGAEFTQNHPRRPILRPFGGHFPV